MNILCFTGNLGGDADLRYTSEKTAVSNFNVAVKSGYGQNEKTIWIRCQIWGKHAEKLSEYLTKGTRVAVNGELRVDEWEGKDGRNGYTLICNVGDVTLMGGGKERDQQPARQAQTPAPLAPPTDATFDDDIPF